ncbi:MAG: phenylalanine--tRNA ligase subunit alpha [Chlamydiota bacterium]|nr:phenylalanine--tRNA ligase subunit alpha [Chlamydiota bacterium]
MSGHWQDNINQISQNALHEAKSCTNQKDLEEIRVKYLGKKGLITHLLKQLKDVPESERPGYGKSVNQAKELILKTVQDLADEIEKKCQQERLVSESVDVTLPGDPIALGRLHPITQMTQEIIDIFTRMGFSVKEGPEIETEYHNFEALNIPSDHPARDMQDTLYVSDGLLLRTHTSPVQIRVMQETEPPLWVIAPGKVYRSDPADVSHSPMFHQVEGLCVDENISFANLKAILLTFAKAAFGSDIKLRFRPSFFPFTEPSAEVDISCSVCQQAGCRLCSGRGWLEVLGAGMVHPKVFEAVGYDPVKYQGFAFGMGVERIAMLKYGIHDIRLFFENDKRFLDQF